MSCSKGVKFLLNEYEYFNQTQETLISGTTPADPDCNTLSNFLVSNNRYQTYFLTTDHYDFEVADYVAIFGLRDTIEAGLGGATTITIFASDNIDFTVNVQEQSFIVSLPDLVGVEKKDWIGKLTAFTENKPYWAVRIFTDIPTGRPVRKVMLGKALSLSRNPVYPALFNLRNDYIEATRLIFQINLNYVALSNADEIELDRLLLNQDFVQGALIDENDNLLLGYKTIMFSLSNADIKLRKSASGIDLNLTIDEIL